MGEKNLSKDGYHENDHVKKDDVDGEYHRVQSGVTVADDGDDDYDDDDDDYDDDQGNCDVDN